MRQSRETREFQQAASYVRKRFKRSPRVALILGSGLGDFADELSETESIDANAIPSYPSSSVAGHAGKLISGLVRDRQRESPPLLVFKGRVHFYETGNLNPTVFPVRLARALGVTSLLVTNAAGGINRRFVPGQLMLITDFFSITFLSMPLPPEANTPLHSVSPRFGPFDTELQNIIRSSSRHMSTELQEGTYCWLKGPSYETAAEIRMLQKMGADAVGMSTVPEIVTALRLGMRVAGISLISNLGTGMSSQKLSHSEVTETAQRVRSDFSGLLREALLQLR